MYLYVTSSVLMQSREETLRTKNFNALFINAINVSRKIRVKPANTYSHKQELITLMNNNQCIMRETSSLNFV